MYISVERALEIVSGVSQVVDLVEDDGVWRKETPRVRDRRQHGQHEQLRSSRNARGGRGHGATIDCSGARRNSWRISQRSWNSPQSAYIVTTSYDYDLVCIGSGPAGQRGA